MRQWLLLCFLSTAVCAHQAESPAVTNAQEQLKKAREAAAKKDLDTARGLFEGVRNDALARRDDAIGLTAVQMLAVLARGSGDWAKTEDWLAEALDYTGRLKGYASLEALDVMTEIAGVRRVRENFDGAAATLQRALAFALSKSGAERAYAARIATTLGLTHMERKDKTQAGESLELAMRLWDETLREDPELLPALDTYGSLLRDESKYSQAAPLFERSLRIRETTYGPGSAELITSLDNLAYVYFGLSRYADAEPLYKRLLDIWATTGGPDHPMLALTLDKVAEFYAAQKRFDEAEPLAKRAAAIRGTGLVSSLRLRARLAALMQRPDESIQITDKALLVMDIAGLPKPEKKLLPAPKDAKPLLPGKGKSKPSAK